MQSQLQAQPAISFDDHAWRQELEAWARERAQYRAGQQGLVNRAAAASMDDDLETIVAVIGQGQRQQLPALLTNICRSSTLSHGSSGSSSSSGSSNSSGTGADHVHHLGTEFAGLRLNETAAHTVPATASTASSAAAAAAAGGGGGGRNQAALQRELHQQAHATLFALLQQQQQQQMAVTPEQYQEAAAALTRVCSTVCAMVEAIHAYGGVAVVLQTPGLSVELMVAAVQQVYSVCRGSQDQELVQQLMAGLAGLSMESSCHGRRSAQT